MGLSNWQKVCDGVFLFQDSCCVYAIQGPEGTVLINAGTGLVADYLDEVFQNGSLTVLLTHHLGIILMVLSVFEMQVPKSWGRIGSRNI